MEQRKAVGFEKLKRRTMSIEKEINRVIFVFVLAAANYVFSIVSFSINLPSSLLSFVVASLCYFVGEKRRLKLIERIEGAK